MDENKKITTLTEYGPNMSRVARKPHFWVFSQPGLTQTGGTGDANQI